MLNRMEMLLDALRVMPSDPVSAAPACRTEASRREGKIGEGSTRGKRAMAQ